MPETGYNRASMTAMGQEFGNTATALNSSRANVQSMAGDAAAAWQSEATRVFDQAVTTWLENFDVVIRTLIDMSEALGVSSTKYSGVDDDAHASMTQLQSVISGMGSPVKF